jgi:CrcB protein
MKAAFPSLLQCLLVALGGGLGALLRYGMSVLLPVQPGSFPSTTFLINALGCLLAGILWGIFDQYGGKGSTLYLFLISGFCGGFTTFSTFSMEVLALMQQGQWLQVVLYAVGSLLLCIAAVALGWFLTQ